MKLILIKYRLLIVLVFGLSYCVTVNSQVLIAKKDTASAKRLELIYEIKYEFTGNINASGDTVYTFYYVFEQADLSDISDIEINKTIVAPSSVTKKKEILSAAELVDTNNIKKSSGELVLKENKVYLITAKPKETPFYLSAKNKDNQSVKLLYRNEKGELIDREKNIQDYLNFLERENATKIVEKFDKKVLDKDGNVIIKDK